MPPDNAVLVAGAGGLGLAAIAMLKAGGHRHIVSLDIDEAKQPLAFAAVASDIVDGSAEDAKDRILAAIDRSTVP